MKGPNEQLQPTTRREEEAPAALDAGGAPGPAPQPSAGTICIVYVSESKAGAWGYWFVKGDPPRWSWQIPTWHISRHAHGGGSLRMPPLDEDGIPIVEVDR